MSLKPVPDPIKYNDWRTWAREFYAYTLQTSRRLSELVGVPVLLARLTPDARAAQDGILMFDASTGDVVVSTGGSWSSLSGGGGGGPVAWTDVTDKPSTFPPSAHNHPISEVTGLSTALAGKSDVGHGHIIGDVSGLATALAGKANASHNHVASEVTDLTEVVQDIVAALLTAGSNITLTYDDGAGTLQIAAAAGGGGEVVYYNRLDADRVGNNNTNAQSWFDAASNAVAVEAKTYRIEGILFLTSGNTGHSVGISFGGSATIAHIAYDAMHTAASLNATTTTQNSTRVTQATNTVVTGSNTTQNKMVRIDGMVTFSGAGDFEPRFQYSVAPGSSTVVRGTFFKLTEMNDVTKGVWS